MAKSDRLLGTFQALKPRKDDVQRRPQKPAAFNHVDAALREMIARILARRPPGSGR